MLKDHAASVIRLTTGNFDNKVSAVTMDGGEISGNSALGISMLPKFQTQSGKTLRFTMNGGVIRDNMANNSGGGIYGSNSYSGSGCTAEVIIHDGKITGNQSTGSGDTVKGGGGVYCNSRFIMDGGTISGNSAQTAMGDGVYFGDGVSEAGITGGTIADNTATGLEDERKGKGSNIYINTAKTVMINPKADINGIFPFKEASLLITAALKHQVELEGAYQRNMDMTDLVVAEAGNGYALTGENPDSFTLSAASIDSIGTEGSGSFSVMPITGLDAGEYRATVTVSGRNGISAGFQVSFKVTPAAATLSFIAATTPPSKTVYKEGETFVGDGMVVTATYSDNSTRGVTGYTVDPSAALTAGTTGVTISYTENGITKTATQPITVNASQKSGGGSTSSSDSSGGNAIDTVVRVQ